MPDLGVAGVISTLICGRGDLGDLSVTEGLCDVGMSNEEFGTALLLPFTILFTVGLVCDLSAGFAGSSPPPSSSMPAPVVPLVACVVDVVFVF